MGSGSAPDATAAVGSRRDRAQLSSWRHWALFSLAVFALVLIPYLILGDSFEAAAVELLREQTSRTLLAGAGVLLLVADVLLPVPSSVVASGLGAALGWALGTAAGALGLTLGCLIGLALGRFAGHRFVRDRLGGDYGYVSGLLLRYGTPVLVLCRGVPVLAEASVIAAGALGMSGSRFIAATTLANIGVAGLYAAIGAAAWETSPMAAFAAALLLPGVLLAAALVARGVMGSARA